MRPSPLPRNIHAHEHGAGPMPAWGLLLPAYTVLPLIRRPLGYATVQPLHLLVSLLLVAAVAFVLSAIYPPASFGAEWFFAFLAASFLAGCIVFTQRAIGQRRGEEIHSREVGYSFLTLRSDLPVPLCEILLVPLALGVVGWMLAHSLSGLLGGWLVICALSYLRMSTWEHGSRLARSRSVADDMVQAQTFSQRVQTHERRARTARPHSTTAGDGDVPDMAEVAEDRGNHARD